MLAGAAVQSSVDLEDPLPEWLPPMAISLQSAGWVFSLHGAFLQSKPSKRPLPLWPNTRRHSPSLLLHPPGPTDHLWIGVAGTMQMCGYWEVMTTEWGHLWGWPPVSIITDTREEARVGMVRTQGLKATWGLCSWEMKLLLWPLSLCSSPSRRWTSSVFWCLMLVFSGISSKPGSSWGA